MRGTHTTAPARRPAPGPQRLHLLGMLLACAATSATAQVPAAAQGPGAAPPARPAAAPGGAIAPAPQAVFALRGFTVTGPNPLGEAETQRVLAPFVRPDATIATLQQATAALEAALRSRGFGLHRVALPPQEVGAQVRLEIVTFAIGKVAIEGRTLYGEGNVRRSVPELREGATPNFRQLAVETAIANENPNKQVQVALREGDAPDRIDATIAVREQRPWNFAVGLSNAGTDNSGRDRLTVSGSHTNLFDRDHQFTGAYTTSVERRSDVRQLGLAYRAPLYARRTVLGATFTRSDVVGTFGDFTSTGAGHTTGLSATHYLPPEGGRRSYVQVALDDKVFEAARVNDMVVPGALDRRSRPLTLGYNARTETDMASWGYNLELAVNTAAGAGNTLAAYQSEDPRVRSVHWAAVRGGWSWLATAAKGWLVGARAQAQWSPDVLIAGEQFGLGGQASVRGTRVERPLSADRGVAATLELTTPELAPGLRLLAFADAGYLENNGAATPGKPGSDRLASAGLGLRLSSGPFVVAADYGRLLVGSRVPLAFNGAAPQRGDDRLFVSLAVRF